MTATLLSLKRPTNILRTRHYSSIAYFLGLGAPPCLNRLHPQLDTSRWAQRTPWRKSTLSCRPLSTHTPPLPKLPRARVVSARELYAQRNRSLFMYTSAVVSPSPHPAPYHISRTANTQIILAVGASYAAVPLYRMFCAATGFAGTPVVGTGRFEPERLVPVEGAKRIKVHFNADRSEQLPWTFTPQQKYVTVLPGETSLAFYKAKNNSDHDVIGIATYNVTPDRVSIYVRRKGD